MITTKRSKMLVVLATVAAIATPAASRATTLEFDFSYTGSGIDAAGELFTSDTPNGGPYLVTAITGMRNGVDISGLVAPGGLGGNDDELAVSPLYVDNSGITYTAGGIDYNFFLSNQSGGVCTGILEITSINPDSACDQKIQVSLTVTPTEPAPEPASLLLIGLPVAATWLARRRGHRLAVKTGEASSP